MKTKRLKGQIALIVLIISAIVMTIGLSVSKKSVVETKITTDEELLKQAFNAAESGVDYYLGTGVSGAASYVAPDNKSQADVAVKPVGGGADKVNLGGMILRNNSSYTWLVGHKADGSLDTPNMGSLTGLTICVDNDFDGGLKVDYFYQNGTNYFVYRTGFNVATAGRVTGYTNATVGGCPVSGMESISLSGIPTGVTPLLLVVKPIADDTKIAVVAIGGVQFPDQEAEISSTGKAGATYQVSRKVNVINQYRIPTFMLDAITAVGNVLSN